MAQDVATNDAELICSHIYSQAPATLAQAQRDLAIFHFHNVNIKDNVEVTFEPGPPRAAQVTFTVVVDVETSGIRHTRAPSFITMTLIQEDGHWRVAQYSHDERALFR
jgi:hypothetical protein